MKEIYLAGGYFWGLQEIRPVYDAEQDMAGKPLPLIRQFFILFMK